MTHLDSTWYERYIAISRTVGETYELLEPTPELLAARYTDFVQSDYSLNPDLTTDKPQRESLSQARAQALQLQADIQHSESRSLIRESYLPAIDALLDNISLIIAGATGDTRTYRSTCERLYGQPNHDIFAAACAWIRADALATSVDGSSHLATLRHNVLAALPSVDADYSVLIPSEQVFADVRQHHTEYYRQLFGLKGFPVEPYIDEATGNEICRRVLTNIGSDYVLAPSDNNLWAILPSRKRVVYPSGYRLDRDEFVGIVCHEIGSHVLEAVNGASSPLLLLGAGLAGYERGNEGRAFLREQIVYDHERTFLRQFSWEYIILLHVATSLAAGAYHHPHSFSELYHTLYHLYYFWRERRMPHATNNEAFTRDEAWYLAVRILKGTPGNGSAAYLKDSVYLEGNVRCWQLAAEDPSSILLGDQGKFDPTNPSHRALVLSLTMR